MWTKYEDKILWATIAVSLVILAFVVSGLCDVTGGM